MPALTHIAPKGQQADSFESPYRAETSFKSLSTFLNRQLTVHSNTPNQCAKFSVLDILKHINFNQATLKGSTVKHWASEQVPADVDLQVPCNNSIDQKKVARSLLDFLNTRSNQPVKNAKYIKEKTWFSRVKHDFGASWVRLIVSVGYHQRNSSTLDLNFTNHKGIAHDTIHASQAIQFDWASRKAFKIGAWHPNLVDWLQKNHLLWFSPDIDEGLGRLSYRLSKSPNACLLQPELASHFCEKATHTSISGIYMRVLREEYPRSTLSTAERQQLWEPVFKAAETGDQQNLRNDLLAWSKFNTLEQVRVALNDPETQAIVLGRLTQACQIGVDFKEAVKNILISNEEYCALLKPLINKALGASMVQGEVLFNMLDRWDQIQEVPEHELQTVFADCLKTLRQSNDPSISSRADNMMGWLNGEDLASLKFWMDRIPEHLHNAPPDKPMRPVMQAMLQIIKTRGANVLGPALVQMGRLRISQADWQALASALLKVPSNKALQKAEDGQEQLTREFMNILIMQSATISSLGYQGSTTTEVSYQDFYQQVMGYLDTLDGRTTPPMLRNVISVKSDGIEISLPDKVLAVSRAQSSITAKNSTGKYFITAHGHGELIQQTRNSPGAFQFYWYDGSIFKAKQSGATGTPSFHGTLTRLEGAPLPAEFIDLLGTARALCANEFKSLLHPHESWAANGNFSEKRILKANGLIEALLALKQGVIVDQVLNSDLRIEHEIKDGKPVLCTVSVVQKNIDTELKIPYREKNAGATSSTEFNNPWGVEPVMNKIEFVQKMNCPPFGIVNVSTTRPWNEETQTHQGTGVIKGSGLVKFSWEGNITPQGLLSDGALYLEKQKKPAIVFNSTKSSSNIPVSLLPVMADLLGDRLNGSYPFSPRVWDDPNRWPIQGFEGFIDRYASGNILFSGYLTSTGRAIGILSEASTPDNRFPSAWAGSFHVRPSGLLNYQPVGLDNQQKSLVYIQLSAGTVLTPHGFVREFMLKGHNREPFGRVDQIYFCGEGVHFRQITRNPELTYDSPHARRYFCGVDYTLDQKEKQLEIVFNPGDGGNDFMMVRPKDHEKLGSYQEIYRDSTGNSTSWLLINHEYRWVDAKFISGLQYRGKVERQGNFIKPAETGTLSFNGLSFTVNFEKDNTIRKIKAMNTATTDWLTNRGIAGENQSFTLKEWMNLISNGYLDWQNDLQSHLRVRELNSLIGEGTVFSR